MKESKLGELSIQYVAQWVLAHFPPQKIEEQRITIEDLEALKELADELEENHIQVERELRDEILDCEKDRREKDLREEKVRVGLLEDMVSDTDGTIARFREVVADMQG
jgi:dynactin 1